MVEDFFNLQFDLIYKHTVANVVIIAHLPYDT